jgi:hypothetical protein
MKSETYVYALRNYTIKKRGDQFFIAATAMAGQTSEPPMQHLAAQFLRHQ